MPSYDRRYNPYHPDRYYTPRNRNYRRSGADPIYRGRIENNKSRSDVNNSSDWRRQNSNDRGYRDNDWNRSHQQHQSRPNNNSWRDSSNNRNDNSRNDSNHNNRGGGGFDRAGGF